ncbi:MAG: YggS family pyridoxal phosphate-dependent enzyme [Phycisphaerae bacterium]|nr:YggS family pyridoxal phosphate-dependent enzyme [Phycisphaerae bacterium]
MSNISERLESIQETIKKTCDQAGRNHDEVKLIVVTKSASYAAVKEVIDSGHTNLGENHVQQLKKVDALLRQEPTLQEILPSLQWHLIGHLQRNKVKQVLPLASLIHSVDTLRLAEEINDCAAKLKRKVRILLQVNTSNEPQKYGVPVGAATHLAEQLETLPHIELKGLMTMAPLTRNKDIVRTCFARAKELFDEVAGERLVGPQFTELSMGMSSDYEIAIQEGATLLRIGSAIFT